ncbi:helix-turn-helix domain-containing protein [Streptomyces lunaelactis]|uniref:helix-turn-helix domain-containing protein n=1 Tax=Streptomyces lunaelactis TaxID=1535768 RepID=UPI003F689DAB
MGSATDSRAHLLVRLLEETDRTLDDVAAACGLGSVETLHRSFRRRVSTTPAEYRRRFRPQPDHNPAAIEFASCRPLPSDRVSLSPLPVARQSPAHAA